MMKSSAYTVAAVDPGRDKCGFAVLDSEGKILYQKVVDTASLEKAVENAKSQFGFDLLLLGNGTTSKNAKERLCKAFPELSIMVVDEYRTTEMAKKEYWKANPPRGLKKLIPLGMQVPPVPVDDFVAVILARRYICGGKCSN